ncbi:MAG: hypothetical protein AVDCRST_MAG89-3896, partial [uncultured Gemmatimonadetes bacterium]
EVERQAVGDRILRAGAAPNHGMLPAGVPAHDLRRAPACVV